MFYQQHFKRSYNLLEQTLEKAFGSTPWKSGELPSWIFLMWSIFHNHVKLDILDDAKFMLGLGVYLCIINNRILTGFVFLLNLRSEKMWYTIHKFAKVVILCAFSSFHIQTATTKDNISNQIEIWMF